MLDVLLLTAFNTAYAEIGSLCVQSIARYCQRHPEYRFVSHLIPDNYPRPASWAKLDLIRRHLSQHEFVLWIDCDALIVGNDDIASLLKPVTLNIAKDRNGINHGVAAWRNCPQSFEALARMEADYPKFTEHSWYEQASLMTFIDELDVHYQPKEVFNAYPECVSCGGDFSCDKSMIAHFPGMAKHGDERLKAMKETLAA